MRDDQDFMDPASALCNSVFPTGPRYAAYLILIFIIIMLAWAYFSKGDIVTVAKGKIAIGQQSKKIQAFEVARVRKILVRDGQQVMRQQPLIELDDSDAKNDLAQVTEQIKEVTAQREIARELSAYIQGGNHSSNYEKLDENTKLRIAFELKGMRTNLAQLHSEHVRRRAETKTIELQANKLQALLPLALQREKDVQKLKSEGFMSQHAVENTTKERIEMERDLATTSARREEAVAGAHSAEHEYNRASATFQLEFNERQAQNTLKLAELTSQLRKIQTRLQHMLIKSPVDGTVQELAIHTQEGIVTTAQVLMVIVPNDKDVSAELNLPSQEIGFVHEGQKVEIKIDAYPFTTYGMLTGDVRIISKDAISDERSGALSYAVRVNLRQSSLAFASRKLPLVPGMTVSGEILTGQRRFISYFIDPISKQAHEGFRER